MQGIRSSLFVAVIALLLGYANSNALAQSDAAQQAPTKTVVELWPTGLPDGAKPVSEKLIQSQRKREKERPDIIAYVETPSMTVYPAAAEKANGCAMIICPGGGYRMLAWEKEGLEMAEHLNSVGVTAFVLKYRVPRRDKETIHGEPLQDVQRAIRLVREGADKWKIDAGRVGVMGFSAGGHLTVMAGTRYETNSYSPIDDADKLSCRPDFLCPIYAAYLGKNYTDDKAELSDDLNLTKQTPPTFLAVTGDDRMRGAQSALLYARLCELGVPAEVHVYSKGGHGYGIRENKRPVSTWHHRMTDWMRVSGFFAAK